jgi:polar amino acid transport system substrate-binding protein
MIRKLCAALLLLTVPAFTSLAIAGDTLEEVKKKGVLVAGVKDSTLPFGFADQKTGEIIGYDVDFVHAIAKRLGVKLELRPVTSANRIPELIEGNIDIIAATMSKNLNREKLIDFSDTYFKTGQKFLVKAGTAKTLKDLEGKTIATAKGSTSELTVRKALPKAKIELFDDYIWAAQALRKGAVDAVTTDGAILYGILALAEKKGEYEISDYQISEEEYGLGVRQGDKKFLGFVNATLREMKKSGEAQKIFDKWYAFVKSGIEPPPVVRPQAGRAGGVVIRRTSVPNRFLVMAMKGSFRTGADVSIFDPQGNFIGNGKVKSIYTDEVYVDVEEAKAQFVETGYVAGMNIDKESARTIIEQKQDLLKSVKKEVKAEEEKRQAEINKEYAAEQKERRKEQVAYEKMKMQQENYRDHYYYRGHYRGYRRW